MTSASRRPRNKSVRSADAENDLAGDDQGAYELDGDVATDDLEVADVDEFELNDVERDEVHADDGGVPDEEIEASASVDDGEVDVDVDDDVDTASSGDASSSGDAVIDHYQQELESRRQATINNARRRGGVAGAAMASVMLTMQEMIEGEKEDAPVVVQASSDPEDFDEDGITVEHDGTNYHAPPLDRIDRRDDKSAV